MKYISIFVLLISTCSVLHPQEKQYRMKEIVVSSGRVPISFATLARSVDIITLEEIIGIPVSNPQDLLKHVSGVDLRARGTEGVQADIAIRGGAFEQTLILIDGIKISDPQTGHHNLNIPVSLAGIERLEVLRGQGSRIYGANAFSGAVNFITRKTSTPSLKVSLLGGQFGLYDLNLSGSIPIQSVSNNISVQRKKSDGYAHNTNFDLTSFSVNQSFAFSGNNMNTFLGYVDKNFGASTFYSDRFPNQAERTITRFAHISSDLNLSDVLFSPKIYWRNSFDDYHLDYRRPDWNHNTHRTQSFGAEAQVTLKNSFGTTVIGGELGRDEIESSNLGTHSRSKGGIFAEQMTEFNNGVALSAGIFAYNYSSIGWKFWPGMDLSFKLGESEKLWLSYGMAFRLPTFTELYYVSPASMGNINLVYEQTTNYEIGFSHNSGLLQFESSLFLKDGTNLIDWVRINRDKPWMVENVSDIKTIGAEISFEIPLNTLISGFPIKTINASYTYLFSNRDTGVYESRYLLDHLRHQLIIRIINSLPFGLTQSWSGRFEQRENSNSHFILDSQIYKTLGDFSIFIRSSNLLNQAYYDIPGVPLAGRWISAGVSYSIKEM